MILNILKGGIILIFEEKMNYESVFEENKINFSSAK